MGWPVSINGWARVFHRVLLPVAVAFAGSASPLAAADNASSPSVDAAGESGRPSPPQTPPSASGSAATATQPQSEKATEPEPGASATNPPPAVLRGPVTKLPNAATLVIAEHRIRLSGIDPGPFAALPSFESWLRGQGSLLCEPDAQSGRYRCFTSNGVDVAEAAILNGAGRVGDGATPSYRERENEARQARRGLWQGL